MSLPSKKLPLDFNISTFGDETRDYQSIQDWITATSIDMVSAKKGEVLYCYDDLLQYDSTALITVSGATQNGDYFRVIMAAPGHGHNGNPNSGVRFHHDWSTSTYLFSLSQNIGIYDCIFTSSGSNANECYLMHNCTGSLFVGNYFYNIKNLGAGNANVFHFNGNFNVWNCFFADCTYVFRYGNIGISPGKAYNCTFVNNYSPARSQWGGNVDMYDCIFENNSVMTDTDNIGGIIDAGLIFKDAANNDYNLDASDIAAIGQGTDRSVFRDDYTGIKRRGLWDLGASQYNNSLIEAYTKPIMGSTKTEVEIIEENVEAFGSSLQNVVNVNPEVEELEGEVYNSITNALAYIATQTPAEDNRWAIKLGVGEYPDNFTVPEWVSIIGTDMVNTILSGAIQSAGTYSYPPDVETFGAGCTIQNCKVENLYFDTAGFNYIVLSNCYLTGGSDTSNVDYALVDLMNCNVIGVNYDNIYQFHAYNSFISSGTISPTYMNQLNNCTIVPSAGNIIIGGDNLIESCTIWYQYTVANSVTFTNDSKTSKFFNCSWVTAPLVTPAPEFDTLNRTYDFYNCHLGDATYTNGTFNHYGTTDDNETLTEQIHSLGRAYYDSTSDMGTDPEDFASKYYVDQNAKFTMPDNMVQVDSDAAVVVGERYQTITDALAYIATQTPSTNNKWGIKLGAGVYTDSFNVPLFVSIIGQGLATTLSGNVGTSGDYSLITDISDFSNIFNCTIENLYLDVSGTMDLAIYDCIVLNGSDTINANQSLLNFYDSAIVNGTFTNIQQLYLIQVSVLGGTYSPSVFLSSRHSFFAPQLADISLGSNVTLEFCELWYQYTPYYLTFTNEINKKTDMFNCTYFHFTGVTGAPTFNTGDRTYNFHNCHLGNASYNAGTFNHYGTSGNNETLTEQIHSLGKAYYDSTSDMGTDPEDFASKYYVDSVATFTEPKNIVQVDPDEEEIIGERYQSITSALAYVATQTPAEDNRWGIKLGAGEYTDSFNVPEWVTIIGASRTSTVLSGQVGSTASFVSPLQNFESGAILNCYIENIYLDETGNIAMFLYNCNVVGGSDTSNASNTFVGLFHSIINGCTFDDLWAFQTYDCIINGGTYIPSNNNIHHSSTMFSYTPLVLGHNVWLFNCYLCYNYAGNQFTFTNEVATTSMHNCAYLTAFGAPEFDTSNRTYNFHNSHIGIATFTAGTFNHYGTSAGTENIFEQIHLLGKAYYDSTSDMGTDPEDFASKYYVDANTMPTPANIIQVDPSATEITGKRYQSIANALTYIDENETPAIDNIWGIRVGGENSENFTVADYVYILGDTLTTKLTGEITSSAFTGPLQKVISGCEVMNLNIGAGHSIQFFNCYVGGGTIGANAFVMAERSYLGIDLTGIASNSGFFYCIVIGGKIGEGYFQSCLISGGEISVSGGTCQLLNSSLNFNTLTIDAASSGLIYFQHVNSMNGSLSYTIPSGLSIGLENSTPDITFTVDGGTLVTKNCILPTPTVNSGTWQNEGELYDNTTSGLTAENTQDAIDEISSMEFVLPENIIQVDSSAPEVTGKRYQSISNALAYISGNESPSSTDIWGIKVYGTNNETFTLQNWVYIIGDGLTTRLTGAIASTTFVDYMANIIYGCTISNANFTQGAGNGATLINCHVTGGTYNNDTIVIGVKNIYSGSLDFSEINSVSPQFYCNIYGDFITGNGIDFYHCNFLENQISANSFTFHETSFNWCGIDMDISTFDSTADISFRFCFTTSQDGPLQTFIIDGGTWDFENCHLGSFFQIQVDNGGVLNTKNSVFLEYPIINGGTWNNEGSVYNNITSGLTAENTQAAIDELAPIFSDNKPIKTNYIDFGILPDNDTKAVEHGITSLDTLVEMQIVAYDSTADEHIIIHTNDDFAVMVDSTYIYVATTGVFSNYERCHVVLKFTES